MHSYPVFMLQLSTNKSTQNKKLSSMLQRVTKDQKIQRTCNNDAIYIQARDIHKGICARSGFTCTLRNFECLHFKHSDCHPLKGIHKQC